MSGGSKDAKKEGSGLLDQASEAASNAANSASDALGLNSACLLWLHMIAHTDNIYREVNGSQSLQRLPDV